ncbi:conserved hypothetical protein [Burkholderia gladioli]|nr:conserved hypothetical protein [Burkholderia gladioli]
MRVGLVSDSTTNGCVNWRLTALLYASRMYPDGALTVPAGSETDFALVQRAPVAFLLAADSAHEASTVHDFLYTAPHPVTRSMADAVLKEASIASGVPAWRAWLMWAGVRIGGGGHWDVTSSSPAARS